MDSMDDDRTQHEENRALLEKIRGTEGLPIDEAVANALSGLSENTKRAYTQQYNRWRRFAVEYRLQLYPVTAADLQAYVGSIQSRQLQIQARTALHRLNRAKDGPVNVRQGRVAGQETHCSKCGGTGHNARGCFANKSKPPVVTTKAKYTRGVQIVVMSGDMKSTFDVENVEFGDAVSAVTDFVSGLGPKRYYSAQPASR